MEEVIFIAVFWVVGLIFASIIEAIGKYILARTEYWREEARMLRKLRKEAQHDAD